MKKTSPLTKLTVAATAALLTFTANNASAGHGNDLIDLSHDLEGLTEELNEEFSVHFSHTRLYRHLVADANRIKAEAKHIHGLAHDPVASLRHISTDLREIDEASHHLHEIVDLADSGRFGHVHGSTKHVHELMKEITEVVHKMRAEVSELSRRNRYNGHSSHHGSRHGSNWAYTPRTVTPPVSASPSCSSSQPSQQRISFGGGRFFFSFR